MSKEEAQPQTARSRGGWILGAVVFLVGLWFLSAFATTVTRAFVASLLVAGATGFVAFLGIKKKLSSANTLWIGLAGVALTFLAFNTVQQQRITRAAQAVEAEKNERRREEVQTRAQEIANQQAQGLAAATEEQAAAAAQRTVIASATAGKHELVKHYRSPLDVEGVQHAVVFVGAFPHDRAHLLHVAESYYPPQTAGIGTYVYFFDDKERARNWSPRTYGSGPEHDGCIGRAYRERGRPAMYTPQSEW